MEGSSFWLLAIFWTILLIAGVTLLWDAVMEKSRPARSRLHGMVSEMKFRIRFAAGIVLLILVASGAIWLIFHWK